MTIDRRSLLLGATAGALSSAAARGQTAGDDYTDDEVVEILTDEAEPLAGLNPKAIKTGFWFQAPPATRPVPIWPPAPDSYDLAHLAFYNANQGSFDISADLIRKYCAACHLRIDSAARVVFGLRGCQLSDDQDSADFAQKQSVKEAIPDHQHTRCLIGVMDPTADKIALFTASTVPGVDLMSKQIQGQMGCNMMPTGLHHYKVGLHRGKAVKQPGALIQNSSLWVHRTKQSLGYTFVKPGNEWDDLDGALPFDDIHAAILTYRSKPPYFSSAGCQVIAGTYMDGNPKGPWRNFRIALGLSDPPNASAGGQTPDDGKAFDYILLTGREANIISGGQPDVVKSLRYGSSGDLVVVLQQAIAGADLQSGKLNRGSLDRKTLGALIGWQLQQKLPPTGILSSKSGTIAQFNSLILTRRPSRKANWRTLIGGCPKRG